MPTPVVGISPWFTTAAQAKNICQANLYTAFKDEMIDGAGGGRSMRHAGWRRAGARPAAVGGTVTSGPVDGPQVTSAVAWDAGRGTGQIRVEVALAAAAFAVLCVTVLKVAPRLVEPDDYAYRGSILAITQGHLLTLSTAQARALAGQLAPATPFLAAPFQALGVIRLAPLFYGALGCLGLFAGARRWLGRFGGAAAVGLFCASGTALLFAWRDYMATFTDASLIAAGTGALLWALLAEEGAAQRRTWIGLAGFVAIEAAVLVRYTNIVMLACAVAAVLVGRWRPAASVPRRALGWWLGSVALFGMGVAAFDDLVYGGLLSSGYRPGEITFSLGAVVPNLRYMPAHLIDTMPMMLLALAGLAWIGGRWTRLQRAVRRWPRRHRPPPWWQRSGWASGPSTRCRTHRTQAPHRRPTAMSGSRIAPALSPQISGGSGRGQRK